MSEQTPRPWWATLLTSVLTSLIGLLTVIVAVVWVRPALDPSDSGIWIGLVIGGATAAGVGGSLLAGRTDQRGHARGSLIVGLLAISLAALGALLLASSAGCGLLGAREVVAEESVKFDVRLGPPCIVKVLADGDLVHTTRGPTVKCGVTIEETPEPPPEPEPEPTPQS